MSLLFMVLYDASAAIFIFFAASARARLVPAHFFLGHRGLGFLGRAVGFLQDKAAAHGF
jgi:hypothetical protein